MLDRPKVRLVTHGEGFALGAYENVVVSVWRCAVTEARLCDVSDLSDELSDAYPEGLGSLTLLGRGVMMSVTVAVRRGAREFIEKSQMHFRCRALVIEGEGFYASTIRSLLIGIGYIHQRQAQLVASVEDAAQHLGRGLERSDAWRAELVAATRGFMAEATPPDGTSR